MSGMDCGVFVVGIVASMEQAASDKEKVLHVERSIFFFVGLWRRLHYHSIVALQHSKEEELDKLCALCARTIFRLIWVGTRKGKRLILFCCCRHSSALLFYCFFSVPGRCLREKKYRLLFYWGHFQICPLFPEIDHKPQRLSHHGQ